MSGLHRQRIGPAKAKLRTLVEEAAPFLAQNADMNQEDLSEFLAILIAKIEKQVKFIEAKDEDWAKFVETLEGDKHETETTLYENTATGDDGYLALVDTASDCLIELRQKQSNVPDNLANVSQNLNDSAVSMQAPQTSMKLKEGHLPTFSGDSVKWPEFWDAFRSAVHENPRLPGSQKFVYLKGALTGKAAETIAGFPLTDINYEEAVTLLKKRFGDENGQRATLRQNWMDLTKASGKYEDLESLHYAAVTIQRRLRVLGDDISHNSLAVQQLQSKIPYSVMIDLEKERDGENDWTVTSLMEKLEKYLEIRKRIQNIHPPLKTPDPGFEKKMTSFSRPFVQKEPFSKPPASADSLIAKANAKFPCVFCGKMHFPDDCTNLKTDAERKAKLANERRCFLCLKNDHRASNCSKKDTQFCFYCKKTGSHHRSICPTKFGNQLQKNGSLLSGSDAKSGGVTKAAANFSSSKSGSTLLAEGQFALLLTSSVTVRRPQSANFLKCRLILDCGSQRSYVVDSLADSLDLPLKGNQELSISTFAAEKPQTVHTSVTELEIFFKDGSSKLITTNVIPVLTGEMKRERLCDEDLAVLKSTYLRELADVLPDKEEFFKPSILIGMDYYFELCGFAQNQELPSGLQLVPSQFGLLIGGRTSNLSEKTLLSSKMISKKGNVLLCPDVNLKPEKITYLEDIESKLDLKDFWSLESMGIQDKMNKSDEDKVLCDFEKTLIFEDSRYHVRWPWKVSDPELPKNYGLSLGRLCSLSKRFTNDSDLLVKYADLIEDQRKKGITENITESPEAGNLVHYLPHHPVITPQKATTKVRIVYDASAKANAKTNSLNDCLHSGPNLIPDLCGMLIRFRLPKIVILSDVEKAFLQVGLQMPDRDVTRFFWFKDTSNPWIGANLENLAIYRFCRIPFGVASSPFLLEAVIKHHLNSVATPLACEMEKNLYVDNILVSAETTEVAYQKYIEGKQMFQDMSMNLREWASNEPEFMKQLPEQDRAAVDTKMKILGVSWNAEQDTISVSVPENIKSSVNLTKRSLLSMVSSVFDPLGLWTPATFFGKVLFQELWKKGFSWDSTLPDDIRQQWTFAVEALDGIGCTSLPRWISDLAPISHRLVVFSDASTKAYGAAVYLLVQTDEGIESNLLFSKMRLKPVKSTKKDASDMSIPRLELMGVVVGVRILNFLRQQMNISLAPAILMTDSQCVLYWLMSNKVLPLFVRNRVAEIRRTENIDYQYVSTDQNPADLLTKGISAKDLAVSKLWFKGPAWLVKPENEWPKSSVQFNSTENTDINELTVSAPAIDVPTTTRNPCDMDYTRFSSLTKLFRVTAYCLRFIKKKSPKSATAVKCLNLIETKGEIVGKELSVAKRLWCSSTQKQEFSQFFEANPGQKVRDLTRQLGLFIDPEGLIRCGGRSVKKHDEICTTAPILLPRKNELTQLIVKEVHEKSLHGGTNHTLTQLRKEFWLTQGRAEVRMILKKCTLCKKHSGGPFQLPDFAPLPRDRKEPSPPFKITGLDYFGPILVKGEGHPSKHWVCLFTCLVVRAVHLELVTDMSTSEFLAAFRRFVARRGCPAKIVSDNGTQMKAADLIIRDALKTIQADPQTAAHFAGLKITWKFIPALSPWQGGVYERMVGIVKVSLKKALGKRLLFPFQLMTLLCEVESMVNSRPITYVTSEFPNRPALTPTDFLLPCNQQNVLPPFFPNPEEDEDFVLNQDLRTTYNQVRNLWKKQTLILEHFWEMWSSEYLNMLKERKDIRHPSQRLHVSRCPELGEIVLVCETGLPRGRWKMGRIIELQKSNDSEIRTAMVQLPNKIVLTRPLCHLYPLEIFAPLDDVPNVEENPSLENTKQIRPTRKAADNCKQVLKNIFGRECHE